MSNEEHVEEMFYLSHISGVYKQFSERVTETHKNNPKKSICEVTEYVFEEFISEGLIDSEAHLFI
jgi:hypothetical protein